MLHSWSGSITARKAASRRGAACDSTFHQYRPTIISMLAILVVLMHLLIGHPLHQAHTADNATGIPAVADTHDPRHHDLSSPMQMQAAAAVAHEVASVHHVTGCATPRWCTQRLDCESEATPPVAIALTNPLFGGTREQSPLPHIDIPRPDGPDRQALLQRFIL